MSLAEDLLGCSLTQITRAYWAVKLTSGEWMCEARVKTDLKNGQETFYDWSNDLVATGDVLRVSQLWLFCPASRTSPLGNTAHLDISEPGSAFQFKIATVDGTIMAISRAVQAHIIGKVTDKETGACECFIWDTVQDGLCTPQTPVYAPTPETNFRRVDRDGRPVYAGKTSVYDFHAWREGLAPLGRLELETLGVRL